MAFIPVFPVFSLPDLGSAKMRCKVVAKAVSYLRCSGLGQVEGDTWDRQTAAITKYAKHHGIEVVDEFRDAGISGTKDLDNRPGLAALLDRVESHGVKIVLVENATRLARDLMIGEVILQQLTSAGCTVIAADSGTDLTADSDDPTRRLVRQVLGAVSEFDRRVTVMKLRAARERKRSRGERCEGRKPFGTFPCEIETLSRIRELMRKPPHGRRRSLQKVCDALNGEGRPTRSGKPWTKQVVSRIVSRNHITPPRRHEATVER